MLMTKYTFNVEVSNGGAHTTVTRLEDGATKVFFNAGHTAPEPMIGFMNSVTDDLADGYFPKPRKK